MCVCVCVCVLNWIFFTHAKLSRCPQYRTNWHMIVNTFTACSIRHIVAVMQYRIRDAATSTAAPQAVDHRIQPGFIFSVQDARAAPISTRVSSQLQSSYLKYFLFREFPSTSSVCQSTSFTSKLGLLYAILHNIVSLVIHLLICLGGTLFR
jgi:hypothetical protein